MGFKSSAEFVSRPATRRMSVSTLADSLKQAEQSKLLQIEHTEFGAANLESETVDEWE